MHILTFRGHCCAYSTIQGSLLCIYYHSGVVVMHIFPFRGRGYAYITIQG